MLKLGLFCKRYPAAVDCTGLGRLAQTWSDGEVGVGEGGVCLSGGPLQVGPV